MQRVRVGLTGLAFVFLTVLLAAIFIRQPAAEPTLTANMIEQQKAGNVAAPAPAGQPSEPLAELGVAPGSADSNNAAPAPAAPTPTPPAR